MSTGVTQKDTTYTKIFVGGLPYHTTDDSLRDFFSQFGEIEEAVVITDRQTGKSRGYGFVTMADRVAAERACKDPNPIIDGRKANVNLAYLGAKPRIQAGYPFAALAAAKFPGILASQYGLPQYVYPQYAVSPGMTMSMSPHSPLSPTSAAATPAALFDYGSPYGHSALAAAANPLEAAYPYTTAATTGYVTPGAAYSYAMPAQPLGAHIAYQPQQLQAERMQ
eukprot:GHVU01150612.1.p1 GENE.GHVU01150612.1~~GHVU01150612.1.p1  ORF type:complete len:223 (+),score=23.95 GHVU01150612.1:179-847(+)